MKILTMVRNFYDGKILMIWLMTISLFDVNVVLVQDCSITPLIMPLGLIQFKDNLTSIGNPIVEIR